jgi:conjugal transfer pilus assembly protein TraD
MVYLAMQAIADLVVALGNNEALAERILSKLNNFIIGATQDPRTLEFLETRLGQVPVLTKGLSQGSGQKTEDIGLEYSANRGGIRKEVQLPMIPGDLLSALPDLHYISILNRAEVRKGRVPILQFA